MNYSSRVVSEETRKKMSFNLKGNRRHKGYKHSAEQRVKLSIIFKKKWQNPIFATKMMKAQGVSPNKKELCLNELLQKWYPNEWKFVGDGQVFINSKCPDFIHKEKKLLIELFGDYWHKGQNPEDRIKIFD